MALFPMYISLENSDCLVIGGGEVALRKIEQLVKFSPNITVIAPEIHDDIRAFASKYSIKLLERIYNTEDLMGRFLVIGALDDILEQEKIFGYCVNQKIHVNCVDSPQLCSFIFPALIVRDDLCVGINTSGRAPAVSSALRKYLEALIPMRIKELIDEVDQIRKSEQPGKERQVKIINRCKLFFDKLK